MAKGSVVVRILSQYDNKGVRAAAKDLQKSQKEFTDYASKVGKAFAVAGAAAAAFAVKVGIDSVRAAMQDQKSAALLANTLKNVTGANDAVVSSVEDFILKTELASGVVDDQLRPALAKLVTVTGNVQQAQSLLQLSLDASAGSGNDLDTVTQAVSKAVAGNFTQLGRLFPIIDKNIIKNKDLNAALAELAKSYKGASAAAADTFEGKLGRVKIAFDEIKESIGYGVLPVLQKLLDKIIKDVVPAIQDFLTKNGDKVISVFAVGVGYVVAFAKAIYDVFAFVSRNTQLFAELGAVIVAAIAGAKVAAAAQALIGVIQGLVKAYKALRTASIGAAAGEALLTGGLSAAAGAAAFGAALIALNFAIDKFEKSAKNTSDGLDGLKFDFNGLKVSANDYLKGLKGLQAGNNNAAASTKNLTAEQKKALEVLAALKKMGIVPRNENDPIELEAARLNLIKQNNLAEAERLQRIADSIAAQTKLNEAASRYNDILAVLADSKISSEEVAVLAQKWGVSASQVVEYIARIYAANSTDTNSDAIVKLYMAWGMTKEEAQKYLDFARALKDEKLDDTEIINLQHKWGLTKAEVLDYAKKVQDGTVFSSTWADPGNLAKKSWEEALAALQAYIDKLKELSGQKSSDSAAAASSAAAAAAAADISLDPSTKADIQASTKEALDAAADANAALAESEKALAELGSSFADSIDKIFSESFGLSAATAIAQSQVSPAYASTSLASSANILESARFQAQLNQITAANTLTNDLAAARYTAMQASIEQGNQQANDLMAARYSAMQNFYTQGLGTNPAAYSSTSTSGTSGGGTTIIVQGNLVTQADNIAAIRNDLLNNQLSGKPITFSAVAI